jgi:hypothetical protein
MKTAMKGSRWFGRFSVALGAAALGLLVTGCEPECVDQFDCARKGNAGEGKQFACVDNRCVTQDIPNETGSDAGTDAGTGSDAGTDAGTGSDAGTDAGVACADLPHDPKLGTLQLQTGFAAAESATIPEGIGAVTVIQSGSEYTLYGLRNTDNTSVADDSIYALGTWPDVTLGSAALYAVVPEADRGNSTYPSGFLTNDGTRLLTGYTRGAAGSPGNVLVYDTATPKDSVYVSAPGNFSAAAVSGAFFINGLGIDGASQGGLAVYALNLASKPFQGSKLATFPTTNALAASGYSAVTSDKVAVFGYSLPDSSSSDPWAPYINHLHALAPALYTPAVSSRSTLALSTTNAPEIYSGNDLQSVAGFGSGVALHRGTFTATRDVARIELTPGGINPESVTAGDLTPVLTTSNTCTNVVSMAPMGPDLLVGVKDKNGRRLVRLQQKQ